MKESEEEKPRALPVKKEMKYLVKMKKISKKYHFTRNGAHAAHALESYNARIISTPLGERRKYEEAISKRRENKSRIINENKNIRREMLKKKRNRAKSSRASRAAARANRTLCAHLAQCSNISYTI